MQALLYRAAGSRRKVLKRSRGAVLWSLAIFAGLQLSLAGMLLFRWPTSWLLDPAYAHRKKLLIAGKKEPERFNVLFLGTSLVHFGVQAELIERELAARLGRPVSIHNWGTPGWGGLRHTVIFDRLRRDGIRPDLVIAEAMPSCLTNNRKPTYLDEINMPIDYFDWADVTMFKRYQDNYRPWLRWEQILAVSTSLYRKRLTFAYLTCPWLIPVPHGPQYVTNRGGRMELPWEMVPGLIAREKRIYTNIVNNWVFGGSFCDSFEKIISMCQQDGIPVAVLVMPEGPSFRTWVAPKSQAAFDAYLRGVTERYHMPLCQAQAWLDWEEGFFDSHHLAGRGADLFSKRLVQEFLDPLIRDLTRPSPARKELAGAISQSR
jgi:hypothetical protein